MTDASKEEAIQTIQAALAAFYRAGWLPAGEGSLSVRGEDQGGLLAAAPSPLAGIDTADVTTLSAKASPAAALHLTVFEAIEDAQSVAHLFPLEALLCGDRDASRGFTHLHGIPLAAQLGADDDLSVDLPVLAIEGDDPGEELADYFASEDRSEFPLINLKNRGVLVWGEDVAQVMNRAEALAFLYGYSWRRPMNQPKKAATAGFGL